MVRSRVMYISAAVEPVCGMTGPEQAADNGMAASSGEVVWADE